MHGLQKQKGVSMVWLSAFVLMAFVLAVFIIKLSPVYFEYWQIRSVLTSLEEESQIEKKTNMQVVKMLQKRFLVNDLKPMNTKELSLSRHKDVFSIKLNYERRVSIFANIDAVVRFNDTFEVKSL